MWIVLNQWKIGAVGLTIAGRYSAVRRQFKTLTTDPNQERRLIDYETH